MGRKLKERKYMKSYFLLGECITIDSVSLNDDGKQLSDVCISLSEKVYAKRRRIEEVSVIRRSLLESRKLFHEYLIGLLSLLRSIYSIGSGDYFVGEVPTLADETLIIVHHLLVM